MIDIAHPYYNNIISIVVSSMEVLQMVHIKRMEIISIAFLWLSNHMLSVHIKVDIFEESFSVSVVIIFVFLADLFLDEFKFTLIQD